MPHDSEKRLTAQWFLWDADRVTRGSVKDRRYASCSLFISGVCVIFYSISDGLCSFNKS